MRIIRFLVGVPVGIAAIVVMTILRSFAAPADPDLYP